MSDIVTKIDLADKNGVLLNTEKKYCGRKILVLPRLNPLEIRENGTYPVPHGFAGNGHVNVNVAPKKETALVVTANGTYAAPPGTVYTSIVVNVPTSSGGTPGGGEGETPHVHKYTSEVIAPSCTMDGFTLHTCACGHSYQSDATDPLGHSYVNGVCTVCGESDPDYKPSNPDVNAGQYNLIVGDTFYVFYDGSSPTVECPNCLTYQDDGGVLNFTAIAAGSGNIYIRVSDTLIAQYTVTVTAVATYDYALKIGESFEVMYHESSPTVECPACLTYQDDGGVLVFTAASVGSGTLRLYRSDTLIATYTINVTAEESGGDTHEHQFTAVVTAPTCTAAGYTTHTCKECGYSYKDTPVAKLGHDWGEGWITVKEATCTTEGSEMRTCGRCDTSETRTVAALVHTWVAKEHSGFSTGYGYVCSVCGALGEELTLPDDGGDTCNHSWVATENVGFSSGYGYVCTKCGELGEELEKPTHEHTWVAGITVEPTCTEQGYTNYSCSCGDTKEDDYVSALGHTEGDPVLTNADKMNCQVCAHYKVYCKTCNKLLDEYDDDGNFGEHDDSNPSVVQPTCTEQGYIHYVCSVCLRETKTFTDPALGHDLQLVADDSQSSGASMKCTRCDYVEGEANYDCSVLGHATDDGSYDIDGEEMFKCKHCGEYYPAN